MVHVNDQTVDDRAYIPMGGPPAVRQRQPLRRALVASSEFTRWQWVTYRAVPLAYRR
jgi:HEAT repeat protein